MLGDPWVCHHCYCPASHFLTPSSTFPLKQGKAIFRKVVEVAARHSRHIGRDEEGKRKWLGSQQAYANARNEAGGVHLVSPSRHHPSRRPPANVFRCAAWDGQGCARPSANQRMGPIFRAPSDPQAQLSMEARSGWFPNGVKNSEHPPPQRPRPPHLPAQPHSNAARSACSCVRLTGRLAAAAAAVADGRNKARRRRRPSTCAHPCNACKSM